jgi:hypothetical protein
VQHGFLPFGNLQTIETTRQRTLRVGARLEQEAVATAGSKPAAAKSIALSIDGGHVRAARQYQGRSFEVLLAQVGNDEGSRLCSAACQQRRILKTRQLRGVLNGLGATPVTPVLRWQFKDATAKAIVINRRTVQGVRPT